MSLALIQATAFKFAQIENTATNGRVVNTIRLTFSEDRACGKRNISRDPIISIPTCAVVVHAIKDGRNMGKTTLPKKPPLK